MIFVFVIPESHRLVRDLVGMAVDTSYHSNTVDEEIPACAGMTPKYEFASVERIIDTGLHAPIPYQS